MQSGGTISSELPTTPALRVKPQAAGRSNFVVVDEHYLPWPETTPCEAPITSAKTTHVRVFSKSGAIDFVAEAFERAYPTGAAKCIANDLRCSHRTTEKWVGREVAPNLHHFLNACQTVPELNAAMRELLGMGQTDPGFQRALSNFVRAAQRVKP